LHFVALFLGRVGRFDPSDRCLVYFSVLHDPFGQFKGAVIVGKDGVEKQLPLDQTGKFSVFEREKITLAWPLCISTRE
jgi:hypothetical protein